MPRLHRLQRHFGAAMTRGYDRAIATLVQGDGLAPAARLAIHRNHYRISLGEALASTFPALRGAVGGGFFDQAARRFVAVEPPAGPCLFEYGERFPAFLAAEPAARAFPYLADLGRFEWAINAAYHATDADPLDGGRLAALPPPRLAELRLEPHPSLRLVASRYPLLAIWRVSRPDGDATEAVSLDAGGADLMVWRQGIDVVWRALDPAEFALVSALAAGRGLADAAATAGVADLADALAMLVLSDGFCDLRPEPDGGVEP